MGSARIQPGIISIYTSARIRRGGKGGGVAWENKNLKLERENGRYSHHAFHVLIVFGRGGGPGCLGPGKELKSVVNGFMIFPNKIHHLLHTHTLIGGYQINVLITRTWHYYQENKSRKKKSSRAQKKLGNKGRQGRKIQERAKCTRNRLFPPPNFSHPCINRSSLHRHCPLPKPKITVLRYRSV